MTKQKRTFTGLPKTGADNGKPSTAPPVGYANLLTGLKAGDGHHNKAETGNRCTKQHGF
jgi:hypothetical protein